MVRRITSKLPLQVARRDVLTDDHPGLEAHPLGLHLMHAAVEHVLLQLEVGDPVAQEPADLRRALEHGHLVAGPAQLLRRGQARRARCRSRRRGAR